MQTIQNYFGKPVSTCLLKIDKKQNLAVVFFDAQPAKKVRLIKR